MSPSIWQRLGIPPGSDRREIRRAYAARLKEVHPEDDPEGFKALREAFELAQSHADLIVYETLAAEAEEAEETYGADADWDAPVWPEALASQDGDAPAAVSEDAAQLQTRLDALLSALHDPEGTADPETLRALLEEVLSAPAMDEIGVHAQVETMLAFQLASAIPTSDPLLERTAAFFGWGHDEVHATHNWHVDDILNRMREWQQIDWIAQPESELNRGWHALCDPPVSSLAMRWDGLSVDRSHQVAELLDVAEYQMTGLRYHFVPERVEWWHKFLAAPRLTADALVAMPIAALAVAMLVYFFTDDGADVPVGAISIFAGIALPLLHLFTLKRFQHRIRAEGRNLPRWAADGWIPAAIALPLVTALLPATKSGMLATLVLALGLVAWIAVAVPPRPPAGQLFNRLVQPIKLVWPLGLIAFMSAARLSEDEMLQWAVASAALAFAWVRGLVPLAQLVDRRVRRWRTAVGFGLAVALVGVAAAIGQVLPERTAIAAALALVSGWIMLQSFWAVEPEENKFLLVLGWLVMFGYLLAVAPPIEESSTAQPTPSEQTQPDRIGNPFDANSGDTAAVPPVIDPGTEGDTREADPAAPVLAVPPPAPPQAQPRCPEAPPGSGRMPPLPCGALGSWMNSSDYPPGALRRGETGTTGIRFAVNLAGRVENCRVAQSSGSAELDAATCRLMTERGRFLPARDEDGDPVAATLSIKMKWVIQG